MPVRTWLLHPARSLPPMLSAELLRVLISTPAEQQEREEQLSELLSESLHTGRPGPPELLERAAELGVDFSRSRAVLLFSAAPLPTWRGEPNASREGLHRAARRALQGLEASVILARVGLELVVFADPQRQEPHALAQTLAHALASEFPQLVLPIGVGRAAPDFASLRRSFQEARTALELAATLPRARRIVQYEEVHHLLIYREIRQHPPLKQLIQESLAPLAELPAAYRRTMLETLAAYLEHGRSPTRAASVLGVHPNTLKYRMKRIAELIDLE